MMKKLLVIGLDGFNIDIYQTVIKVGGFQYLSKILDESTYGSAEIDLNQRGWAVGFTGQNSGSNNAYYYTVSPTDYSIIQNFNAENYYKDSIWNHVGQSGKKVGIIGVPTTYPPLPVNGFIIAAGAGGLIPQNLSNMFYPSGLVSQNRELFAKFIPDVRPDFYNDPIRLLKDLKKADASRVQPALALKDKFNINLLIVGFIGCDRIGHLFWDEHLIYPDFRRGELDKAIFGYFQQLDKSIKTLIEACPGWNVVLFSDHGMSKRKQTLYINSLLVQLGFAKPAASIRMRLVEKLRWNVTNHFTPKQRQAIKSFFRRHKNFSAGIPIIAPSLDWAKTRAFGYYMHGVFINRKSRYPKGIITDDDYESTRDKLINQLKGYNNPITGGKMFKQVCRREELISGHFVESGPDIFFQLPKGTDVRGDLNPTAVDSFSMEISRDSSIPTVYKGIHSRDAFFAIKRYDSIGCGMANSIPLAQVYHIMNDCIQDR